MFVVYERSEAMDNCDEKNKYYLRTKVFYMKVF